MTIENFRAYSVPTTIDFDDITTIIGRNDVGKSTILEALEIFFNNETVKLEQGDCNVFGHSPLVTITAEFSELPVDIVLDSGVPTSLADEHLVSEQGTLVIRRVYDCSKKTPSAESFLLARHPTAKGVDNLLELKEKELQALVKGKGIEVSLKGNPGMRRALWENAGDLAFATVAVPVSKTKEDSKQIWEQIERHLPMFALFQSDRASRESDGEIQNPLKGAIATAIAEVQDEIERIQAKVRQKSEEIARLTHDALKTIDPKLARTLVPKFTPPGAGKWTGLFSLGMDTDDAIPLNKRGSGVRRIILVSFFKAEAERKLATSSKANIIYAIEEPETSQHPSNQRILIESFKDLARAPNCQVILTTHSPGLAADLPVESIRFVSGEGPPDTPTVERGLDVFGKVADVLGVTPGSRVKVIICVEGPTDVEALRYLSHALHVEDSTVPSLLHNSACAFVVLGGSNLKHWVTQHYLENLRCPEVHIYDSDVASYGATVLQVNERSDGRGSWGVLTSKHEIECYLHPEAIKAVYGVSVDVVDHPDADHPSVPAAFAASITAHKKLDGLMKDGTAKTYLSKVYPKMTAEMIRQRDPDGEVEGWFRRIGALLD
ncbi:putative ATP-dependent endonuclease of OLD family [Rhizobium sp. PP-F2F-G38]|nr:putative ATP-dependent endonuclease of OLD family [Rhizobium sp. PP-F2F-G38]